MKKTIRSTMIVLLAMLFLYPIGARAKEAEAIYTPTPLQQKMDEIMAIALQSNKAGVKTYLSSFGGAYIEQDTVVLLTTKLDAKEWRPFQSDPLVKMYSCKHALNHVLAEFDRAKGLLASQGLEWISVAKSDHGGSLDGDYAVSWDAGSPQYLTIELVDQDIAEIGHLMCINGFDMDMTRIDGVYHATVKRATPAYDYAEEGRAQLFRLKKGEVVLTTGRDSSFAQINRMDGTYGYVDSANLDVPAAPNLFVPNEGIRGTMLKTTAVLKTPEKNAKKLGNINKFENVFVYAQLIDIDERYARIAWEGGKAYIPLDCVALHSTAFEEMSISVT